MSKHIYSAGSLRAALSTGSLAARVSPHRGPVHLEVLPENALRVISTHEDAYACAYADSDRPAPAALAGRAQAPAVGFGGAPADGCSRRLRARSVLAAGRLGAGADAARRGAS